MSETALSRAVGCIDHIVIAVGDLDRNAEIYRRLGFTLSPKGVHSAAMGTANHTIMLQHDYFELIAVTVPTDRNTRWRQALDEGGGVAGVALTTEDAAAAHAYWSSQGLSPDDLVRFSRAVTRNDGATLEARFEVVSLAEVPGTGLRIFVCSQPTREAVWLPELMTHANTAQAIDGITLASPDPHESARQWRRVIPDLTVSESADGVRMRAGKHRVHILTREAARAAFGVTAEAAGTQAIGIDFSVGSLDACRATLESSGVTFRDDRKSVMIRAEDASNVAVTFRQP